MADEKLTVGSVVFAPAGNPARPRDLVGAELRTATNEVLAKLKRLYTLRPAAEYRVEYGPVLWWRMPGKIRAAAITPTKHTLAYLVDGGWYWSPLPDPTDMVTSDGEVIHA